MEDLFLNDTNQVSPKESRFPKVFLTRSKFLGRVPENLEALESTLEVLGFRVINTEFMSLRDQISLFSNVEVVISLSGAALTNLMFCKSKTQVFFIPPDLSLFSYVFWSDYAKLFNLDFMTLDSVVEGDSGEIYRVDIDNLIGIIATHS
jgi:capsular polysaccharide biosynthesis protein